MKKNVHFRVVLLENSRKFFILSSSEDSNHDRSILKSIVYIKIGFKRSKNEEEERKHAIFVNSRHPLDSRKKIRGNLPPRDTHLYHRSEKFPRKSPIGW